MRFDIKLGKAYSTVPKPPIGEVIAEINNRAQRPDQTPAIMAGFGIIALCLAIALPVAIASMVLVAGLALAGWLVFRGRRDRITTLHYDCDQDVVNYFSAIQLACRNLAGSEKVWLEDRRQAVRNRQKHGGASYAVSFSNTPVKIRRCTPPFIDTNLEIWGIDVAYLQLFFFPDYVFVFRRGFYSATSYSSLTIQFEPEIMNVRGAVPRDAQLSQVPWTSAPANQFGQKRISQVRYGLLRLVSSIGVSLRLHVSNSNLAEKFTENFSKVQGVLARHRTPETVTAEHGEQPPPPKRPAHDILGIKPDASLEEIKAAYYRVAKMNHPDRVSGMAPEFRDLATRRIREINAAYIELRHQALQRHHHG